MRHVGRGEDFGRLTLFDALTQQARRPERRFDLMARGRLEITDDLREGGLQAARRMEFHSVGHGPSGHQQAGNKNGDSHGLDPPTR